MERLSRWIVFAMVLIVSPTAFGQAQKDEFLTEDEQDKVREAQDPSERIQVYVALAQARLDRFTDFRKRPADAQYDIATYLDQLLSQYLQLTEEMKDWIQFQYQRHGDMRPGLRTLLEQGSKQLEDLRRTQQSPDAYASTYGETLRDAIDQLTDTLDGATKALGDQQKTFAEEKREAKAAGRLAKERAKEETKRTKEEKKLRKRQRRGAVPADSEDN